MASSGDPGTRAASSPSGRRWAPSLQGLITTRDVFLRGTVIVQEFGVSIWLRCCLALLTGRRTTFLEVVFAR